VAGMGCGRSRQVVDNPGNRPTQETTNEQLAARADPGSGRVREA
jgi:hypothetical protein